MAAARLDAWIAASERELATLVLDTRERFHLRKTQQADRGDHERHHDFDEAEAAVAPHRFVAVFVHMQLPVPALCSCSACPPA